ncbi:MAG: O-antigen ligase domain-containing protein [Cyanobacteria bacterium P01_D01_bin.105]
MSNVVVGSRERTSRTASIGWSAIFIYGLISALLIALKLGSLVNIVFPMGALAVGLTLYTLDPPLYAGFIWWLCFLSPFVRRLADFSGSYTAPSPILLAPYLAILVALPTFVQKLPSTLRKGGFPFILAAFGILYGYFVGCAIGSPFSATLGLLEWFSPVIFGFYFFLNWRSYPQNKVATQKAFIWGLLLMGAYGIYQYLVAPDWERFWLVNFIGEDPSTIILLGTPFGTPEPLGIRVWSTMNGPYTFASFIIPGLLFLLSYSGPLQPLISAVGYLSFLLSLSRTAWVGWLVSMSAFFVTLKPNQQMRFIALIVVSLLATLPFVITGPFSDLLSSRIESLFNISNDGSGAERAETYQALLGRAFTSFLGYGLGNVPDVGTVLDSAILLILFELGLFGAIPYLLGLLLFVSRNSSSSLAKADTFLGVSKSFAFGSLFMFPLAPILNTETAIALWGFVGLKLAGNRFYNSIEKRSHLT